MPIIQFCYWHHETLSDIKFKIKYKKVTYYEMSKYKELEVLFLERLITNNVIILCKPTQWNLLIIDCILDNEFITWEKLQISESLSCMILFIPFATITYHFVDTLDEWYVQHYLICLIFQIIYIYIYIYIHIHSFQ